ncbi:GNAT family N-acetyltransferase [Cellvibrio sp. ARAG 10.3]|uniref:GNAT family N-acetyltransferase n=1 Tax=Cellvibrio sp. ARAG 10.3 TaxID=3451358 RepID=UPI003F48903E
MNEDKFIKILATEFFTGEPDKAHQYDASKGTAHPNIIIWNGEQIGCMAAEWPTDCVPGFVQLAYLYIYKSGQGLGSVILRRLCELADELQLEITLDAVPQKPSESSIPQEKLINWYQRHGFVLSEIKGSPCMTRKPLVPLSHPLAHHASPLCEAEKGFSEC